MFHSLRRLLLLAALPLCVVSCGTRRTTTDNNAVMSRDSFGELMQDLITVLGDSTSTWQSVEEATTPLALRLVEALGDEDDLGRRMSSQEIAYETIVAVIDKYHETQAAVGDDDPGVDKLVSMLDDAIFQWFLDDSGEYPQIWRDHYYVSNKEGENPVADYFHLSVLLPTKEHPEPTLHIFYPETAERDPVIVFRDLGEDGPEDIEGEEVFPVERWEAKGDMAENARMFSVSGAEVVARMLTHQVMYIFFESGGTPDGDEGELEIARMPLAGFQERWREYGQDHQINP